MASSLPNAANPEFSNRRASGYTAPMEEFSRFSLADIVRMVETRRRPPVELWNPEHCGHSAMRIAGDGTWYHEGRPIGRPAMVRLFASILRREPDGSHVLVTPVEKLTIDVDDAAFLAVELKSEGEGRGRSLAFRLNTDDLVVAGPEHALSLRERPYLTVRQGLEALIARPVYYELAALALAEGADPPGLWSRGRFFALEPAA